jgi:hypothetical protein
MEQEQMFENELRAQEEQLLLLAGVSGELKGMASTIHGEVVLQNKILGELKGSMVKAVQNTEKATSKLAILKRKLKAARFDKVKLIAIATAAGVVILLVILL